MWFRPKNATLGWHLTFLGYKTDVEVCSWTYTYLLDAVKRFSDKFNAPNRSAAAAYNDGIVHAIRISLEEAKRLKDLADRGSSACTALVVAKRAAIEEQCGPVDYKQYKARSVSDAEAYYAGVRDGRTIAVNPKAIGDAATAPALASKGLKCLLAFTAQCVYHEGCGCGKPLNQRRIQNVWSTYPYHRSIQ